MRKRNMDFERMLVDRLALLSYLEEADAQALD